MSDIFYLRDMHPPIRPADIADMFSGVKGCFDLHRVNWRHSVITSDGTRLLCWYEAPDAEAARNACNQLGADMNDVWPGTAQLHGDLSQVSLMLECTVDRLPDPASLPAGIEEAGRISSSTGSEVVVLYSVQSDRTFEQPVCEGTRALRRCTVVTPD